MQQETDRELLKKYLRGECSPAELERVKACFRMPWATEMLHQLMEAESAQDWERQTEERLRFLECNIGSGHFEEAGSDMQMETWKAKFEQRKAAVHPTSNDQQQAGFFKRHSFLKYAAVWIPLVLGIGIYAMSRLKEAEAPAHQLNANLLMKTFSTVKGQRAKVILSDSTVVYMGPGSKLKYPDQFADTTRRISLEGEAFFEVAHNPHKPFIISTGNVETRVLGTSFKVNAVAGMPFGVQVATGKVRVDRIGGPQTEHLAILTPGQEVKLSNLQSAPVTGQVAIADVKGWKNSRLVFKDQPLKAIATQLERAYNVQFSFKHSVKAAEIVTVTLQDNVPLNQTLRVLSSGAGFRYIIDGKNILIY
uniref:FecR family protein n=1 Tax=Pedobacter schmidteae TaxID=2201271 RepID=UPI000EAF330E|nr:FecR family protein [Pedobacter schmidteae]